MILLSILLVLPLAAVIPAVAGLVGAGINYFGQKKMNQENAAQTESANTRSIQFQWDMYNQQRRDALADRDYNSPEQQMIRLKEAGLNPNLIYGQGAQTAVAQIRSSNAGSPRIEPYIKSQMPLTTAMTAGLDSMMAALQQRSMSAQTDNLYAQQALINAQTANTLQQTAKSKFDLELAQSIKQFSYDAAKLANQKTMSEIDKNYADRNFTVNEDLRKENIQPYQIKQAAENIFLTQLQQKKVQLENEMNPLQREKLQEEIQTLIRQKSLLDDEHLLKLLEIQWQEKQKEMRNDGMNPNSPTWQLQFYELWKKIFRITQ